jgi:surface protein
MFEKTSISTIDLSSFDTSNLAQMKYIFDGCKELVSVNLDNFNLSKFGDAGNSSYHMFN